HFLDEFLLFPKHTLFRNRLFLLACLLQESQDRFCFVSNLECGSPVGSYCDTTTIIFLVRQGKWQPIFQGRLCFLREHSQTMIFELVYCRYAPTVCCSLLLFLMVIQNLLYL